MGATKSATIVGCGIAGPVLGMSLGRAGVRAEVFEARREDETSGGAFLGVAPNGMYVLDVLGVGEAVRARGSVCRGLFTGLYGLTQRFALSLSAGTAGRRDDEDGNHRETPISAGGVFLLTPGARFRVAIPLRTGVAIHHQVLPDGASKRFAIYTLDAGVSGHLLVHGPAYVGGIIRGQLQVSPWDHQVDFAASFEIDLALLF